MTSNERERIALDLAQEECAELAVVISKVKRFGILSDNDGRMPANNRALLIQEMADVEYFINFMRREYKVDEDEFRDAYHRKCQKVNKYLYPEEKT